MVSFHYSTKCQKSQDYLYKKVAPAAYWLPGRCEREKGGKAPWCRMRGRLVIIIGWSSLLIKQHQKRVYERNGIKMKTLWLSVLARLEDYCIWSLTYDSRRSRLREEPIYKQRRLRSRLAMAATNHLAEILASRAYQTFPLRYLDKSRFSYNSISGSKNQQNYWLSCCSICSRVMLTSAPAPISPLSTALATKFSTVFCTILRIGLAPSLGS